MVVETVAFDARYVCDRYHGIGRHAFNLIEALSRLDPERRYLAFFNPYRENRRFALTGLAARPNVELVPIALPLYAPWAQVVWPILLRQHRADLFHSPYFDLPLLTPVRRIMTVHDLIFERYPEYMPQRWLRAAYRTMTGLSVRAASAVLTVSRATAEDLAALYPRSAGKTRVIGGAVDSHFRPEADADRRAAVRGRYGLPDRFLLTLGAGRPHKNVQAAVAALARLDLPRAVPLVIGGDIDRRFPDPVGPLVERLNLEDRVLRIGAVDEGDLPTLYSLAEALVFPSLVEGFGLPVLEAMACGTPVVASSLSSVPEVAGEAALLVDPSDEEALAAAIGQMLTDGDLRARLRVRGLARAAEQSWDCVARTTLAVYDQALAG